MKNAQHLVIAVLLAAVAVAGCRSGRQAGETAAATPAATAEPTPPPKPQKEFIEARGIYLTGWSAGGKQKMQNMVAMMKRSGLNAVVIDVKDSDGAITFPMDIKWAREVEAKRGKIKEINQYGYAQRAANIDWTMQLLKENNIYPIARIAVFADDILSRVRPDMAVHKPSGGIWENRKKEAWLNPYNQEVWDYQVAVAAEAAKKGFKEIQWDYVRFPTDGNMGALAFPGKTDKGQADTIAAFLGYAREKLAPHGVVISADIFGLTGLVKGGMGIGQVIHRVAENVDYICPMVYPSHYHKGEYGIANPNSEPYQIVFVSLRDAKKRLADTNCKIRPWLQNFSLPDRGRYGGSTYGPSQIAAQIKAARDNGITEFLMWDPKNRFNGLEEALARVAKEKPAPKPAPAAPKPAGSEAKPAGQ
ncbi:MAG: putative glycoside hydrolase [Armatimonadetes bacterium]|nr:putative glycoside hydrolase [Armatimonadota bacterium]